MLPSKVCKNSSCSGVIPTQHLKLREVKRGGYEGRIRAQRGFDEHLCHIKLLALKKLSADSVEWER
jgi:hypothetical protein